jgi:hypothetical protein
VLNSPCFLEIGFSVGSWNIQDAVMGVFDLSAVCKLTCFVDIVFTFEGRRTIVVSMVKAFVQFFSFALVPAAPFTGTDCNS